jgi:hypothetical protein
LNENEQERFEAELRRTPPAPLPKDFLARLQETRPDLEPTRATRLQPAPNWLRWWRLLRWLAPATALAVAALLLGREKWNLPDTIDKKPLVAVTGLKPDDVQVDQELVSSFDVVATLPGGEPVRFRCRQWKDQLVVTDKSSGVEIVQNNPHVEVVPVRFETY